MDVVSLLRGLLGLAFILGLAVALSSDRRAINWRTVGFGLLLQLVFAVFILKGDDLAAAFAPLGWPAAAFDFGASFFVVFLEWVVAGASFLFGNLAVGPGADGSLGFFFAFQVLPTIIVFSSLMSILYYLGVMQRVVRAMAWVVSRALQTSGPESLSVTANIFVGQTEAPLVIRPYIERMSRSELLAVMTGGMATIAGGVMASYIQFLGGEFAAARGVALAEGQQLFAEQLLGASVMAAPAALLLAKILIPETRPRPRVATAPARDLTFEPGPVAIAVGAVPGRALPDVGAGEAVPPPATPPSDEGTAVPYDSQTATEETVEALTGEGPRNLIDAAAAGAADGLKLALNVGAMLIAFLALIAGINYFLGEGAALFDRTLSLEMLLGWVLAPVAWLVGVPAADMTTFGSLLGQKIVANEFVAYLGLAEGIEAGTLSPKGIVMATFALCGFANFSSIAIQIGGIGPLAPSRTGEIAELGLRAVLAGTLANLMTATIAGVLLGG